MKEEIDVYKGGEDGYHSYRIPALTVTPSRTVLAFCEGRKYSENDDGKINILLRRRLDGTPTWCKQVVVHEEGGDHSSITIGNPCPIVDHQANRISLLFTRSNGGVFCTSSLDDGASWSVPDDISAILKDFDFNVLRVGTGPGHGIQMNSGRLVAPVWLCDSQPTAPERNFRSGVIYSDDHGQTWHAGGLVPPEWPGLNECTVFEKKGGILLLNMRLQGAGYRAASLSEDGGLQWSQPTLEKNLLCPTCHASIIRLPEEGVVFANPAMKPGPSNYASRKRLTLRLSLDEGASWSGSRLLNEGPSGYADLAFGHDGRVFCLYECGEERYNEKIRFAELDRRWILDTQG